MSSSRIIRFLPMLLLSMILAGPLQANPQGSQQSETQIAMKVKEAPAPARVQTAEELFKSLLGEARWSTPERTRERLSPMLFDGLHRLAETWFTSLGEQAEAVK